MEKMDKNSEAYKSGNYDDLFEASDTGHMANEELVTYSNSLQKLRAVEAGREYMRREYFEEGIAIGEKRGLEIGEKRGLEIGEKRGLEIGEKRGLENAALKLMGSGVPDDFIMKTLGLSERDMEKLRRK